MTARVRLPFLVAAGLLSAAASITGSFAPAQPASQSVIAPDKPVVILVQNPRQMEVVLDTCRQLLNDHNSGVKQARVLVCGQAITAITADEKNVSIVKNALQSRVEIEACGISLQKLEIDPAKLAPGVVVVENALITAIRLKSAGWISVDL